MARNSPSPCCGSSMMELSEKVSAKQAAAKWSNGFPQDAWSKTRFVSTRMSCRKRGKAEHIKPGAESCFFLQRKRSNFHDGERPGELRGEEKHEAPGRFFELRQALQAFL